MKTVFSRLQRTMREIKTEAAALGVWWVEEMREIGFTLLEWLAPKRAQRFVLDVASGGRLRRRGDGAPELLVESPERSQAIVQAAIVAGTLVSRARVDVLLPASEILVRRLRLPPVKARDLERVIALQLERELPLDRAQLCIDWDIEVRSAESLIVAVAIARRARVDAWRDAVQSWGWQVGAIGLATTETQRSRFNLLSARAPRIMFALGRYEGWMIASAAVLALAYFGTVGGQWWYERRALAEPLLRAEQQLAELRESRAELRQRSRPLESLRAIMQQPAAPQMLAALSGALPTDAWVYEAEIATPPTGEASIKFVAHAPAATALLDSLRQAGAFARVELVEAASSGADGKERVEIAATLTKVPR